MAKKKTRPMRVRNGIGGRANKSVLKMAAAAVAGGATGALVGGLLQGRWLWSLGGLAVAIAVLLPVGWLARRLAVWIEVDDGGIRRVERDGRTREVRWADARRIEIVPSRGAVDLRVEPREGEAIAASIAMALGRAVDGEAERALAIVRREERKLHRPS